MDGNLRDWHTCQPGLGCWSLGRRSARRSPLAKAHLTSAGATALAQRVESELRGGDLTGGPSYTAALAYVSIMPPGSAAQALRARAAAVAGEARRLDQVLEEADAPEIHMIEVHYLLTRLNHDRQWLTATAHRIETGQLAWP